MTNSGGSSATKTAIAPRKQFRLSGPSLQVDPHLHVVRDDLADIELADRVFAPHYAAALRASLARDSAIHVKPDGDVIGNGNAGDAIALFDTTGGWSWIRHGQDIGYVPADTVSIP